MQTAPAVNLCVKPSMLTAAVKGLCENAKLRVNQTQMPTWQFAGVVSCIIRKMLLQKLRELRNAGVRERCFRRAMHIHS